MDRRPHILGTGGYIFVKALYSGGRRVCFHSLQPMSLHRGGSLIEQSHNLMKTQISHLEAKITFNLFINNFIIKHLNLTTIPCESDNYNVQTFHCRVCHLIIDENVSDDNRTDIIFIKYQRHLFNWLDYQNMVNFPPPSDVPRISMLTKGF
jgi:hypothetical protein